MSVLLVFVIVFIALVACALIYQLITNMKIVGGNELGVISGNFGKKGFTTLSGGRIFSIPLLNKFAKMNLTPHTIEVVVDSAIAEGIIPLNVKATVSFAIASNEAGRDRAVTRILHLANDWDELRQVASNIIEGHLRDAIATMTPEQVMQDKDTLVARMINVCKNDLENIGLEITTMNIADVDDHRLKNVTEPDLYIALLKRVQTANAETEARRAKAELLAGSTEQQEARRAEVEVRNLENEYQRLEAETRLRLKEEEQRKKIGVEKATRDARAKCAGLQAEIEAEKQNVEMLKNKNEAEIITPALAEKERLILAANQEASELIGKAQGEIDELKNTIEILSEAGDVGRKTYLIENFAKIMAPFAETLSYFPVDKLSIITGADGTREPISAVHPHAIDSEKNSFIQGAVHEALQRASDGTKMPM
ncbi:MAG: hypothetical protein GF344_15735 [Chitinivibrionales bacterium]|nr:hypothetical protein [Chitinivibrionales bacterium]MBD3358152.1 hypothetical protein [Chitinivibrionales bacterium]